MSKKVNIAIDAMGGENSPKKIIEGIKISLETNKNNFFYLYGDQILIDKELQIHKSVKAYCSIVNTKDIISEIANLLPNKVSLENADWEIIVQVLRNKTGVSIIPPNSILSVNREKRVELD